MAKYSKNDIIRIVDEEDIEFIRLQFTDIFGTIKKCGNYSPASLRRHYEQQSVCSTARQIEGFVRIEESDMYLAPGS